MGGRNRTDARWGKTKPLMMRARIGPATFAGGCGGRGRGFGGGFGGAFGLFVLVFTRPCCAVARGAHGAGDRGDRGARGARDAAADLNVVQPRSWREGAVPVSGFAARKGDQYTKHLSADKGALAKGHADVLRGRACACAHVQPRTPTPGARTHTHARSRKWTARRMRRRCQGARRRHRNQPRVQTWGR